MARLPLAPRPLSKIRIDVRLLIALIVLLVLWASAFAGIRAGLKAYTPGHLALFRFFVASATLFVYALLTRMRLPALRDIPSMLLLGFLGITVYQVALTYGEQSVSAGASSLLVATVPCFTTILAAIFLRERVRLLGWIGIFLSFIGVIIVVFGQGGGLRFAPGALLILLASLSESVYFVIQKPYLKKYSGIELTTYTIWMATLLCWCTLLACYNKYKQLQAGQQSRLCISVSFRQPLHMSRGLMHSRGCLLPIQQAFCMLFLC